MVSKAGVHPLGERDGPGREVGGGEIDRVDNVVEEVRGLVHRH